MFTSLGIMTTDEEIMEMVRMVDTHGRGQCNYDELQQVIFSLGAGPPRSNWRQWGAFSPRRVVQLSHVLIVGCFCVCPSHGIWA